MSRTPQCLLQKCPLFSTLVVTCLMMRYREKVSHKYTRKASSLSWWISICRSIRTGKPIRHSKLPQKTRAEILLYIGFTAFVSDTGHIFMRYLIVVFYKDLTNLFVSFVEQQQGFFYLHVYVAHISYIHIRENILLSLYIYNDPLLSLQQKLFFFLRRRNNASKSTVSVLT